MTAVLLESIRPVRTQPPESQKRLGAPTLVTMRKNTWSGVPHSLHSRLTRMENTTIPGWEDNFDEDVRNDLLAAPNWRWLEAHRLLSTHVKPEDIPYDRADEYLLMEEVIPFFHEYNVERASKEGMRALANRHPHKMRAMRIYEISGSLRWYIEALVLAGETREAIALELSLNPMDIYWYECFYFDLRPHLSRPVEVCMQVFNRLHKERRTDNHEDFFLKLVGWVLGKEEVIANFDPREGLSSRGTDLRDAYLEHKIGMDAIAASAQRRPNYDNEGEIIEGYLRLLELKSSTKNGANAEGHVSVLMQKIGESLQVKSVTGYSADGVEVRASESMAAVWTQRIEAARNTTIGGAQ